MEEARSRKPPSKWLTTWSSENPPSIPLPCLRAARTFTHPSPSNRANAITTGQWRPMPSAQPTGRPRSSPRRVGPIRWWSDSIPQGKDWRTSPWFGTFRPYDNGWIYHAKLGWAYAQPDGSGGLWLWMKDHRWTWTQQGVFPYLWKHQTASWHYLLGTKTDNRSFTSGRNPPRRRSPKPRLPVPPSAHTPGQFQFPKSPTWPDRQGDRSPPCGSNRGFAWRR